VAFLTPEGFIVMIVLNDGDETQSFNIQFQRKYAGSTLPANTVATYVWRAN
jgi:glucosylceramidase